MTNLTLKYQHNNIARIFHINKKIIIGIIKWETKMFNISAMRQDWKDYNPSKTMLFWLCVASIALTIFVGFNWGGWVTGRNAREMAQQAAGQSRAETVAVICVDRFMKASDAQAQMASLHQTASWVRRRHLEDAGWVTLPGSEKPVAAAADICAARLMESTPAASLSDGATTLKQ